MVHVGELHAEELAQPTLPAHATLPAEHEPLLHEAFVVAVAHSPTQPIDGVHVVPHEMPLVAERQAVEVPLQPLLQLVVHWLYGSAPALLTGSQLPSLLPTLHVVSAQLVVVQ